MIAWATFVAIALQVSARDAPVQPAGTAMIAGTVVGADASAAPLRKVVVSLSGGGFPATQEAVTDDAGHFVFSNLPAGTYTLTASRASFVRVSYGEKRPGGSGVPIAVTEGQRLTTLTLKMLHGSAITGSLRTASGHVVPNLANISVEIKEVQTLGGDRRISSVPNATSSVSTDDRGVYRAYGLPPGDYVVAAIIAPLAVRPMTPAEIQWGQQAIQQGSASLGASMPSAQGSGVLAGPPPDAARSSLYASVYYPGTAELASAGLITLGAGEERSGVDFPLPLVHTARIEGTVVDPSGRAVRAQVSVMPAPTPQAALFAWSSMVVMTMPDGGFMLTGIPPGNYVLFTRSAAPNAGPVTPGAPAANPASVAATPSMWATESVSVSGEDISNVTLRLQPGMTLSGKVVFAGTLAPPADLTRGRAVASPVPTPGAGNTAPTFGGESVTLNADGTFVITGLAPNMYRLSITMPGTPPARGPYWTLKSIIAGNRDVIDLPIEIKPHEDVSGAAVTFTDGVTDLAGTVIDPAGRPTSQYPIVVFPIARASWPGSRFIKQARPASDGTFDIRGLPPGSYYLSAVTDLDGADLTDMAFLDQLAAASIKVTLGDGETKRQDVKIGGGS
jgi:hypothetical protein